MVNMLIKNHISPKYQLFIHLTFPSLLSLLAFYINPPSYIKLLSGFLHQPPNWSPWFHPYSNPVYSQHSIQAFKYILQIISLLCSESSNSFSAHLQKKPVFTILSWPITLPLLLSFLALKSYFRKSSLLVNLLNNTDLLANSVGPQTLPCLGAFILMILTTRACFCNISSKLISEIGP